MKKLLLLLSCLFILTACGQELEAADIAGVWKNDGARIRFGEDGGYEITYAAPEPGGLSSENGEFELDGGTVELRLRDKYTVNELGETDFQRLTRTEDRKLKIGLEGDVLTLDGEEYGREQTG